MKLTRTGRNPRQKKRKKNYRSCESSDEEGGGMEIPELDDDDKSRKGGCFDDESLRTMSPDAREAMVT